MIDGNGGCYGTKDFPMIRGSQCYLTLVKRKLMPCEMTMLPGLDIDVILKNA